MSEPRLSRVRVLIIDDSAAVRRLLTDILDSDAAIEVVGAAPNAAVALEKIGRLLPDVVTLDVEMPDVSGLELLARIRKVAPTLPVIMFSSLTQKAAATTLEALSLGATDYVTKPAQTGSREASAAHVREQLIPKIKLFGTPKAVTRLPAHATLPVRRATGMSNSSPEIVVVGSSTGGPNALSDLFGALPADLPVPVLITQHMPPLFTHLLAERLTAKGPLAFHEAKAGDTLKAGECWIAPGDYHMRLERAGVHKQVVVRLDHGPPENSCRPAVDVMFRSVAEVYGGRVLAIVLTGMGQDGLKGAEQLRAAGAQIIAQDEASSVVWGMPGFIARAGLADSILPLNEIAAEVERRVSLTRRDTAARGAVSWK
jgi:two-component system, chemotaxis family, protein-glutamate methylesterase/glutaminase